MTLGDVLDGGFKLLRANLGALLLVSGSFLVPLTVLYAFGQRWAQPFSLSELFSDQPLPENGSIYTPSTPELVSLAASGLLWLLFMPTCIGAITSLVARSYMGEQAGAGEALREAFRRYRRLLGASLLSSLLALAPLVPVVALVALAVAADAAELAAIGFTLLLPAALAELALLVLLSVMVPAIMVERVGPVQGIRRSFSLVRSRFWPVLGILLLMGLLADLLSNIIGTPFWIPALLLGGDRGWPFLALASLVPSLVVTTWVAVVAALIYFDLRIRREGLDLQLLIAGLSDGGPPAG
ncbi:MAG TPA: hypothetical protein VKG45_02475 [Actinomycetes bacterium]|nr:hypothetical protein [Actinomycetes bacterium]